MRPKYTLGSLKQDQTPRKTKAYQGIATKRIPLPHNQTRTAWEGKNLPKAQLAAAKARQQQSAAH